MKLRLHVQADGRSYDFEHAGPAVTVGRNPAAALVLEQESAESVVSWDHARIDLAVTGATVTDLSSTNGTFLNSRPVTGTAPLRPGDTLRFGQTGPVLTVAALDLSAPPVPPAPKAKATPARVAASAAGVGPAAPLTPPRGMPAAATVPNGRAKKAAPPAMSETRGILLEAIRQQSEAHTSRRRELGLVAVCVFLLIALLAGGLWVFGDRLRGVDRTAAAAAESAEKASGQVGKLTDEVKAINTRLDRVADQFGAIDRRLTDQEKQEAAQTAQLGQLARDMARQEEQRAKGQGKLDELATNLDQLNQKLAKSPARAADAPPPPPAAARRAVSLKPGDRVEVLFRETAVVGSLVSVTAEKISLLIIDGSVRKDIPMKEVKAIQTRDGIFALNRETGGFESAVTFYRLNTASGTFEKMDAGVNVYNATDVVVENGPERFARALWAIGPAGEKCVGLPVPEYQSPPAIDAKYLKTIVTTQGEYTYSEEKRDYEFRTHQDRAMAAKAAKDQFWKEREEQRYKRLMEGYEAGTRRLQALAPLWWRRWWWW
jgi:uncharacterized coiled-coil protein SlyX